MNFALSFLSSACVSTRIVTTIPARAAPSGPALLHLTLPSAQLRRACAQPWCPPRPAASLPGPERRGIQCGLTRDLSRTPVQCGAGVGDAGPTLHRRLSLLSLILQSYVHSQLPRSLWGRICRQSHMEIGPHLPNQWHNRL